MEYKIIIQENMDDGEIYIHNFPLEPNSVDEAMKFRELDYHADCVFVLEYCEN